MAIAEFFNKYKTIKINNSNGAKRKKEFNNIDWLFAEGNLSEDNKVVKLKANKYIKQHSRSHRP